jgi:hypothetical protein
VDPDPKDAIRQALSVFTTHKNSTLHGLISALQRAGFSKSLAVELSEFLPLAFARAFLESKGVRFADYYIRVDQRGTERARHKLIKEPIFREALGMVMEAKQLGKDTLMAVASRSSELETINNALRAGKRPEQVTLGPPHLPWSEEHQQSKPSKPSAKAKPKSWWQIWK